MTSRACAIKNEPHALALCTRLGIDLTGYLNVENVKKACKHPKNDKPFHWMCCMARGKMWLARTRLHNKLRDELAAIAEECGIPHAVESGCTAKDGMQRPDVVFYVNDGTTSKRVVADVVTVSQVGPTAIGRDLGHVRAGAAIVAGRKEKTKMNTRAFGAEQLPLPFDMTGGWGKEVDTLLEDITRGLVREENGLDLMARTRGRLATVVAEGVYAMYQAYIVEVNSVVYRNQAGQENVGPAV